jgi:hypothetical protein
MSGEDIYRYSKNLEVIVESAGVPGFGRVEVDRTFASISSSGRSQIEDLRCA